MIMKKDEKKKYKISELSREQITRAKRYYYNDKRIKEGFSMTFGDFEIIDELVSDEELFKAYSHLRFEEDAFRW